MTRMLRLPRQFGFLLLVVGGFAIPPLAGQEADRYPGPFPGGYPSMSGIGGSGKMYMESYFPPPVTASPTYPAFSPDGGSIAFAYQGRIWAVSAEGGVARQLTSGAGYHSQPSWSSDGRHIAYAADVDLNLDIFLLDIESGESRRLTEDPAIDMRPRFSPDGSRILFTTGRDGTFDLWGYDLGAGALEAVIAHPRAHDMAGDWIGDTGDIVFVSKRGEAALGSGSLWRWSAGTGEAELLIRIETNYQASPVVAPHGGSVAYVTDASGNNDIYQVPTYRAGAVPGSLQPGDPAGAAHALPHGRILPIVVARRGAPRIRPQRRQRGGGADDRRRHGVRALHDGPRRRRAGPGADRGLRVVGADGPACRCA
ncbi:hypothetical protein [Candidatus Palauibacter sp.]|uniref:hypothetical protein n=1 Tax=Candidatus Palauibacter sp. TaxID=3101350 RepID=UPI003AF27E71